MHQSYFGSSHKLKIEGTFCTKIQPTDGVPENQDENISIHNAYAYIHGEKKQNKKTLSLNFTAILTDTYTCAHASTHACTHTIHIIVTAAADNSIMTEQILKRVKEMSL